MGWWHWCNGRGDCCQEGQRDAGPEDREGDLVQLVGLHGGLPVHSGKGHDGQDGGHLVPYLHVRWHRLRALRGQHVPAASGPACSPMTYAQTFWQNLLPVTFGNLIAGAVIIAG